MQQEKQENRTVGSPIQIGAFFSLLYCMALSGVMLHSPFRGGALYLAGRCFLNLFALRGPIRKGMLGRHARIVGIASSVLFAALLILWTGMRPGFADSPDFGCAAGIILCVLLRPAVTRFAVERWGNKRFFPLGCLTQIVFLVVAALLLLSRALPGSETGILTAGFALCGILECCFGFRTKSCDAAFTDADKAEMAAVEKAHAYKMYQRASLAAAAAMQATLAAGCACIAAKADRPLLCLPIGLLCAFGALIASEALLRRPAVQKANPNLLKGLGLAGWLAGLTVFVFSAPQDSAFVSCLSFAFCAACAAVCVRTLTSMETHMRNVGAFALGHAPGDFLENIQRARREAAALTGQTLSLTGMALISFFAASGSDGSGDFGAFLLLLSVPALLLACASAVFEVCFPLTKVHLIKLRQYARQQRQGIENLPLKEQLEPVAVGKSFRNYGIRLVELILRPFFYHKVRGTENVQLDEDVPCVLVCNHGEILGPVVCTLFVPYQPFRPWSAYEMMDKHTVIDRTMNGTFQNVKGVWRKALQWLMEHIGAPFLVWLLESEYCIRVYHDNPRKLMQTFRETVTTMQAGDSILVFPENADTSPDHRYMQEGVSEFFTGFTMIGQMYYNKTGKCPLFVPMYADKRRRVMTFGRPTRYDADAAVNTEKERLCAYLRNEILSLAGLSEKGP
ncbi:MAG: hypothetical protein IK099_02140 [Clostridia bacterium]|nr:hypothetical protein [Clostridia bacterium]